MYAHSKSQPRACGAGRILLYKPDLEIPWPKASWPHQGSGSTQLDVLRYIRTRPNTIFFELCFRMLHLVSSDTTSWPKDQGVHEILAVRRIEYVSRFGSFLYAC